MPAATATATASTWPPNDLGPLAWVLDELRKSLDPRRPRCAASCATPAWRAAPTWPRSTAASCASRGSSCTRPSARWRWWAWARRRSAAAHGSRGAEVRRAPRAVQRGRRRQGRARRLRADRIPRRRAAGKAVSAVALFPQYRDVQELAGADRIHPADLWGMDWRWNDSHAGRRPTRWSTTRRCARAWTRRVLRVVKTGDAARRRANWPQVLPGPRARRRPRASRRSSGRSPPASSRPWRWACCRRTSTSSAPPRACCCNTRTLAKGELACPTGWRRTWCSSARRPCPRTRADAPRACRPCGRPGAWRASRRSTTRPPVRPLRSGAAGPGAQAHRRRQGNLVGAVRRRRQQAQGRGRAVPRASPIRWSSSIRQRAAGAGADQRGRCRRASGAARPAAELAMEVATAVLYLEAAFEDLDPSDSQLAARTARLAERLDTRAPGRPAASRSSPGWRSCTAASATARPWAASSANCAARWASSKSCSTSSSATRRTRRPLRDAPEPPVADARRAVGAGPRPGRAGRAAHARDGRGNHRHRDRRGARARRRHVRQAGQQPGRARLPDRHAQLPADAGQEAVRLRRRHRRAQAADGTRRRTASEPAAARCRRRRMRRQSARRAGRRTRLRPKLEQLAATSRRWPSSRAAAPGARSRPRPAPAQDSGARRRRARPVWRRRRPSRPLPRRVPAPTSDADIEEDDLLDIFLEEAREVVQNGLAAIDALAAEPGDVPS